MGNFETLRKNKPTFWSFVVFDNIDDRGKRPTQRLIVNLWSYPRCINTPGSRLTSNNLAIITYQLLLFVINCDYFG